MCLSRPIYTHFTEFIGMPNSTTPSFRLDATWSLLSHPDAWSKLLRVRFPQAESPYRDEMLEHAKQIDAKGGPDAYLERVAIGLNRRGITPKKSEVKQTLLKFWPDWEPLIFFVQHLSHGRDDKGMAQALQAWREAKRDDLQIRRTVLVSVRVHR
jgi:hypothetical protein